MKTATNSMLALKAFLTCSQEPNLYSFDNYGLRKACGLACEVLLKFNYELGQGAILDQINEIWTEARELDDAIDALAKRASGLRQRAIDALNQEAQ
jgi:hypothetical protein